MMESKEDRYLESTILRATCDTMSVASNVLGFDLLELWSDDSKGGLHCTYVHATPSIKKQYPDLITGHYPAQKAKHKLSPQVLTINNEI